MSIDASGDIGWTPADADLGYHQVTVQVTDPVGNAGTQSFYVDVRGPSVAPSVTSAPVTDATAGAVYTSLIQASDPSDGFRFSLVNPPSGMSIDAQTGNLFWKPTTADLGPHAIDVRVTNDRGLFADQTFTLTVSPDTQPPTVSIDLSSPRVDPGQTVTIHVKAQDNVAVRQP